VSFGIYSNAITGENEESRGKNNVNIKEIKW
jgi:hypothetical protein